MRAKAQTFDPRQSMSTEKFEIFHYRDSKPVNTEVHYHDFYEVCCFLGGDVEYWVEGRTYSLKSGDLLLINPMELHRHIVKKEYYTYERIVLWINKEYLESISEDIPLSECFTKTLTENNRLIKPSAAVRGEMTALLGELVSEYYSKKYGAQLCAFSMFLRFMVELNRITSEIKNINRDTAEQSSLILQVLDYIAEHYSEELSLEELSQKFYVSKYYLSHEFSNAVGTSVYRYILLKRLLAARRMLLDDSTPGEACIKCGFKDYTNFFRAFKSEYGICPRDCTAG